MNTLPTHNRTADSVSKLELRNLLLQAFLPPPTQGRGGNRFPDAIVTAQNGQRHYFHSDLIANKVVMLHFMTLDAQSHFPALEHMAKVAEKLGDRLGKEVAIYSITTAPEQDTVERLAAYAQEHALPNDWLLLRSEPDGTKALSDRFARHLSRHHHQQGVNMRMVHYGNGGVGIWGAFAIDADPDMALSRVEWLQPGLAKSGELSQAGPAPQDIARRNANSNRDS